MMRFLDDQFAPVTFSMGFVEASFSQYSQAFVSWWEKLSIDFETTPFEEDLRSALLRLQPLQSPQNRYLLVETKSPWTALFSNGLRTADVSSPVGHLCQVLNCRGLEVTCIPDRSHLEDKKDALRIYGAVGFTLLGPQPTDSLNRVRSIWAMNDGGHWKFISEGIVQPYEHVERYTSRKISERFTPEMLESYCEALGIKLYNEGFYGPKGLLVNQLTKFPQTSPRVSINEARAHLYLSQGSG